MSADQALRVADVLLRDENLGMVLVDLRDCDRWELRRVRSTVWYRLQRLAGQWGGVFALFTPQAMIPSSQIRVELTGRISVAQADESLGKVTESLALRVLRLRKRERGAFPQMVEAG